MATENASTVSGESLMTGEDQRIVLIRKIIKINQGVNLGRRITNVNAYIVKSPTIFVKTVPKGRNHLTKIKSKGILLLHKMDLKMLKYCALLI